MNVSYIYLIAFAVSLFTGILLNRFFLNRNNKFLVKKANKEAVRFASQSKPVFGGITFFSIFFISMLSFLFINGFVDAVSKEYLCLFITITMSFCMGLADDLIGTPPIFKFLVQFAIAAIFIYSDMYIIISPLQFVNYFITVIWVVGVMNSINMLDNMDSITNITSLVIIGSSIVFALTQAPISYSFITFVSISVVAAMLSFLIYNWSPAKMYMGDSGSQFLGTFLAFIGIMFLWNNVPLSEVSYGYNSKQIIVVALAFIVPITDTTTVTINRLLKKKSPFVGGRDHTTHFLSYLGLSVRWIGILFFVLTIIGNFIAYHVLVLETDWNNKLFWIYAIFPITVFLLLYINTKITKTK